MTLDVTLGSRLAAVAILSASFIDHEGRVRRARADMIPESGRTPIAVACSDCRALSPEEVAMVICSAALKASDSMVKCVEPLRHSAEKRSPRRRARLGSGQTSMLLRRVSGVRCGPRAVEKASAGVPRRLSRGV